MSAIEPPHLYVRLLAIVAALTTISPSLCAAGDQVASRARDELQHLLPHIEEVCEPVRQDPGLWPLRSFPYGPLGLEIRKAKNAGEADSVRNFQLGMAAAACGVPQQRVTNYFFCGPACPQNRRDHIVKQMGKVRKTLVAFESISEIRLISIWAPKGEIRVNDLYVIGGVAREAIPSPEMGLVPSGRWRNWPSLASYLTTKKVQEKDVIAITEQMRDVGLSALLKDAAGARAVGVGVGDNESGLAFITPKGGLPPRVGIVLPDGRKYSIVEEVEPGVFYYETT
jgi:hypothetical protein